MKSFRIKLTAEQLQDILDQDEKLREIYQGNQSCSNFCVAAQVYINSDEFPEIEHAELVGRVFTDERGTKLQKVIHKLKREEDL